MSRILDGIARDVKLIQNGLKAKFGDMGMRKLLLGGIPYVMAGYGCDKAACLWRVSAGSDVSDKMMSFLNHADRMFVSPFPSFHPKDLLIGICCGVALRFAVYCRAKNAKKFRLGAEYGSARWSA